MKQESGQVPAAVRFLLVLALAFACAGCGPGASNRPKEDPSPPPDLSVRPYGLAGGFVKLVQDGKYDEAYARLSQGLRREWTPYQFKSVLAGWRDSQAQTLKDLVVQRERLQGDRSAVEVGPGGDKPLWVLYYRKLNDQWVIVTIEGEPFPALEDSETPWTQRD